MSQAIPACMYDFMRSGVIAVVATQGLIQINSDGVIGEHVLGLGASRVLGLATDRAKLDTRHLIACDTRVLGVQTDTRTQPALGGALIPGDASLHGYHFRGSRDTLCLPSNPGAFVVTQSTDNVTFGHLGAQLF